MYFHVNLNFSEVNKSAFVGEWTIYRYHNARCNNKSCQRTVRPCIWMCYDLETPVCTNRHDVTWIFSNTAMKTSHLSTNIRIVFLPWKLIQRTRCLLNIADVNYGPRQRARPFAAPRPQPSYKGWFCLGWHGWWGLMRVMGSPYSVLDRLKAGVLSNLFHGAETLTSSQLIKNFSAFFGIRMFNTLSHASPACLYWAR